MVSIKKNLFWNVLLMVSGYVFPLLTFPYVTRILGAGNLGIANFAMSVVDYAIIFASFGLVDIGTRYISHSKSDLEERNKVFSALVSLHILMTFVIVVAYVIAILIVPQLRINPLLYLVGVIKIVFNIFLVEWLFQGMQEFRYITIRTIITRILYVLGIFVFVRNENDYEEYFYISIAQLALNAILNWRYSRKFVTFRFSFKMIKEYVYPVFSIGINRILLSFYNTFNVLFLGLMCTAESVGYFTTATKLYGIFIGLVSAFNGVLVPHLNTLVGEGNLNEYKRMIGVSFSVVSLISIPISIIGIVLAPEIIRFIAGEGYNNAVLPFQIIMVQIILVSIAQITENQILLTFKRFNQILIGTISGTVISVLILFLFVQKYAEVASAIAVAVPHFVECMVLYVFAKKTINFDFPVKEFWQTLAVCIPIILICLFLKNIFKDYLLILIWSSGLSIVYFFIVECFIVKNKILRSQVAIILKRVIN